MKAVVLHELGGIEGLRYEDFPTPEPGQGEVLVKVKACGVNHVDIHVRRGTRGPVNLPLILGVDIAGQIAELGPGVDGARVGDDVVVYARHVCDRCEFCRTGREYHCQAFGGKNLGTNTHGGYAEYVKTRANSLIPLPKGLSHIQAAGVGLVGRTAWHALFNCGGLRIGETCLIQAAASGVGSAAVQLAKLAGARVIATASSDEKLASIKDLGADDIINYTREDFQKEVLRLTSNRGVDLVLEQVGGPTFEQSLNCLARTGRLVTCGATAYPDAKVNIWQLFLQEIRISGALSGSRADLARVLHLAAAKRLKPIIHKVLPLAQAAQAQQMMENRALIGKVVLEVG